MLAVLVFSTCRAKEEWVKSEIPWSQRTKGKRLKSRAGCDGKVPEARTSQRGAKKKPSALTRLAYAILTALSLRLRPVAHCDLTLKGHRLLIIGIDCHRTGGIFPRLAEVTLFQKYATQENVRVNKPRIPKNGGF